MAAVSINIPAPVLNLSSLMNQAVVPVRVLILMKMKVTREISSDMKIQKEIYSTSKLTREIRLRVER